jgi:hypothetical protein
MSIEMIEEPGNTAVAACAALRTFEAPAIGAFWPGQGGVNAGLIRGANGQPDAHVIVCGSPAGEFQGREWGEYGKDVPGATSKTDGAGNTQAMADAGSQLAKDILALDIDGHKDWHLPSQAQLQIACANVPELFSKDDWYWSSTQLSRNTAYVQDFEYGDSLWIDKDLEHRVRAFRVIQLQPLSA